MEIVISRFASLILFWLSLQIVNFRFIPVAHQLNFCLAVSLVWATILSVIRASEASHVKEIESIDTISITNYSVEATQQWPWSDCPLRKKGKKILCANFRGCHQLSRSYWLAAGSLRMRLAMLQFVVSPYEANWAASSVFEEVACVADAWK